MKFENIIYEKKDGVARIAINRPERYNAFDFKTLEELIAAFGNADADSTIGVVVLSGEGGHFCTGGYIDPVSAEATQEWLRVFLRRVRELMCLVRGLSKPVIAAVRGYCIGGGNELNLWCDLTIASENAKFGQVGPRVGSSPIYYGAQGLPILIGEKRAREVVYLCRVYDARDAERMGWINKVVPDERLEEEVEKWSQEILDKSPQYLRISKVSLNTLSDMFYSSVSHGGEMLTLACDSEQYEEGKRAFLEKRKPRWKEFRK